MSLRSQLLKDYLLRKNKATFNRLNGEMPSAQWMRKWFDKSTERLKLVSGTQLEDRMVNGVKTLVVTPKKPTGGTPILYLHGGGYVMGSTRNYRSLISKIAQETSSIVYAPEYRLAPEFPFPNGLMDCLAVYEGLRQEAGDCSLGGDSAGGGMSMALLLELKEKGLAMPKKVFLMSPWVDLTGQAKSLDERDERDPILVAQAVREVSTWYADQLPLNHPKISPLFADLSGLPPILVQIGTEEILYDDSIRLAENLKKSGGVVELKIWKDQVHVWQLLWPYIPEAKKAIREIAVFLN